MFKIVIDEDMPRSTTRALKEKGFQVLDVRDCGLRGKSDKEVFNFAQENGAIILTADMGFSNILRFPLGSHSGIVIAHFPNEISTSVMNHHILIAFEKLTAPECKGNLIIIEPGKMRIKRKEL